MPIYSSTPYTVMQKQKLMISFMISSPSAVLIKNYFDYCCYGIFFRDALYNGNLFDDRVNNKTILHHVYTLNNIHTNVVKALNIIYYSWSELTK